MTLWLKTIAKTLTEGTSERLGGLSSRKGNTEGGKRRGGIPRN